jgi:hypothetical protein
MKMADRLDAARVAIAAAIAPPIMRDAITKQVDFELALLRLRMVIGEEPDLLGNSVGAAIRHYASSSSVTIAEALDAERRYVTVNGPRFRGDRP